MWSPNPRVQIEVGSWKDTRFMIKLPNQTIIISSYTPLIPLDSPSALAITTSPFTILGTCSLCEVQHAPAWANDHPTNHSVITKYSFYRRAKGNWAIHWRKIPMNFDKQPFQGHPCFWMLCVSAKAAKPVCGCSCDKPLWLTCFSNVACKVSQAPRAYC